MTSLLKWWLISCLTMLGIGVSVYFDIHTHLYNSDVTRLSYLILFIFVCIALLLQFELIIDVLDLKLSNLKYFLVILIILGFGLRFLIYS